MQNTIHCKIHFFPLLFYLQKYYLILNSFFSGSLVDSRLLFVIMAMILIYNPANLNLNFNGK